LTSITQDLKLSTLILPLLLSCYLGCGTPERPLGQSETVATSAAVVPVAVPVAAKPAPKPISIPGFVCIAHLEGVSLDLRYKTTNNFMQQDLYRDYDGCYLHEDAAAKLEKAASILNEKRPGWRLRVLDALRPREIQEKMFAKVKGTKHSKYVADPRDGSGHCYGMSVDVTLEDANGNEIDMGTPFDDFTPLAQPRYEAMHLKQGKLTREQYENRLLLRSVMREAGFGSLKQEWWHFNARGIKTIKSRYRVVESIPAR
jgi:zinc D-Ala-D-Ala dipeptidase